MDNTSRAPEVQSPEGSHTEQSSEKKKLEIRGFLKLDSFLRKKYGGMPVYIEQDEPISGFDLAKKLGINPQDVEVIFVNGFVYALDYMIEPGDRMAFLPPGCPGPYRIALGFYGKNQDNAANFKIPDREDKEKGDC